MLKSKWNLKEVDNDLVQELAYDLEIPAPIAAVMVARGLQTEEAIQEFCDLSIKRLHNPNRLPDIGKVLERLNRAIDNNEKIFCWGDYDVDGVTATAVVVTVLKKLGANLDYHAPHRMTDGYDIKLHSVDMALEAGASLLMSVDCGILAFDTAEYAKTKGLDLIITDHHHPSEDGRVPDCIGVVNPNRDDPGYPGERFADHAKEGFKRYPFDALAGVGIAFKVMIALAHSRGVSAKSIIPDVLEYVALGTVADVAPMIDENRTLVSMGCQILSNSEKPGIKELLRVSQAKNVTTTTIGFALGPRINAIGRLGDSAIALDLLLENNDSRAKYLADILDTANKQRQTQQEHVVKEALEMVQNPDEKKILVVWAKGWHKGLVGLVAGKLAENYGRPALCVTVTDDGKTARGSCRSYGDFNILNALKSPGCEELFHKCGGHAFAAGFELPAENLPLLDERLNIYAQNYVPERIVNIDARIHFGDINVKTLNAMNRLAPFGNSNTEPIFLCKNAIISKIETLTQGKHLKMTLTGGARGKEVKAVAWRMGHRSTDFEVGSKIDVVFKLSLEEFRGQSTLTLTLEDFNHSEN